VWENTFNNVLQSRIEDVIHIIQIEQVKAELLLWVETGGTDLLAGTLLISRYQYPDLDTEQVRKQIDLIKRDGFGLSELNKIENIKEIKHDDLVTYDIESLPLLPILVDTGYLTIKNIEMFGDERVYLLDYPNREVNVSILNNILPAYSEKQSVNVNSEIIAISRSINSGDLNKFFSLLKSYFASIPYELIEKKRLNEKYFQLLFYLLMRVTGFMVNTEDRTSSGRIDMVLETSSKIYLFEFKVNSTSRIALEQIKEKKYYEKYENVEDKKLLLVGINFDLNSNFSGLFS
jgi:hypothetical protein